MELANLSLTSIKLCSPVVVFIIYVIVSGISLFMSRNTLKRFNNQKMENLYNLHSWSEVKLVIVLGVIIYGLCQYDQMNLAWLFLLLPVIYLMLKNLFVYYNVSIAHQNAPKDPDNLLNDVLKSVSVPTPGASVYPNAPIVKKEVDTNIFGMRGDPTLESSPPTPPRPSLPPTEKKSVTMDTIKDIIEPHTGPSHPPGGPSSQQNTSVDSLLGGASSGSWMDQF